VPYPGYLDGAEISTWRTTNAEGRMERPCIGSFLVDDGNESDGIALDPEAHPSLLQQQSKHWNRTRLLLEGPAPIASSLILDLGMSLASNEPCRCGSRFHQQCENCLAVAILRPFDEPDEDSFPMLCCPQRMSNLNSCGDLQSLLFHRKQSLQRIQVNRFANIHDLLHYLLTMAGRPIQQQPLAGILVDQLDRLVGMEEDSTEDSASDAIRKSQVSMYCDCDAMWIACLCSCLPLLCLVLE
jgi:hypothetical protein